MIFASTAPIQIAELSLAGSILECDAGWMSTDINTPFSRARGDGALLAGRGLSCRIAAGNTFRRHRAGDQIAGHRAGMPGRGSLGGKAANAPAKFQARMRGLRIVPTGAMTIPGRRRRGGADYSNDSPKP